jgi:pyrroloquinoline quinone biosynthesis protein B
MTAVAKLRAKIVFTHLNHTNPALDPTSRERKAVEALGMRIAQEGYVLPLS